MNWSVGIRGDPVDLDILAQRPLAVGLAVVKNGGDYVLISAEFDAIDDAGIVKARAEQILSSLTGAIRLRLDARRSLSILSIQRSRPDGTREVFFFAQPIVCESRAFAIFAAVSAPLVASIATGHPLMCLGFAISSYWRGGTRPLNRTRDAFAANNESEQCRIAPPGAEICNQVDTAGPPESAGRLISHPMLTNPRRGRGARSRAGIRGTQVVSF